MKKIRFNKNRWLRLDDKDNLIDYLEKCAFFIQQKGKKKWKWVIIALRQGLYNTLILSLAGTNYENVLKVNKKNKLSKKLIDFPVALERVWGNTRNAGIITETIKNDCILLNDELRNNFEHFTPNKSWSIQLSGMPRIINNVTSIISFLLLKSGCIYLSSYKARKAKQWLKIIRCKADNFY